MILVTIPKHCAPQTVTPIQGPRKLAPGASLAAEFDAAAIAYMKASPGHYVLSEPAKPTPPPFVRRKGR